MLPKSQKLGQIQNSWRAVVKATKFCRANPILRCLHWLKITELIWLKLLSITDKVLATIQPPGNGDFPLDNSPSYISPYTLLG